MAREKELADLASKVVLVPVKEAAQYMAARGYWAAGTSTENNTSKAIRNMADQKILEVVGKRLYRWPGSRCEGGEHAVKLSRELIRILCVYPDSSVRREVFCEAIRRRIDALVLTKKNGHAALVVFECALTERDGSLEAKRRDIETWPGALAFFGQQFGLDIPSYTFVTSNELNQILED